MENINDMMSSGMLTVYFNKYIYIAWTSGFY